MTATDRILVSEIDCMAAIGVTPGERAMKQRLSIDVEFALDARRAAQTDSIKDTVDYSRVAKVAAEVCISRDFHLIETVAEAIAARVLGDFPISKTRVLVRKISPVAQPRVAMVSVEIERP